MQIQIFPGEKSSLTHMVQATMHLGNRNAWVNKAVDTNAWARERIGRRSLRLKMSVEVS